MGNFRWGTGLMLLEISKPTATVWFIAHNKDNVYFHNGETHTNQVTTTALDMLEQFTDENAYIAREEALNIDLEEPT
jgi:mannose-6-phosphate isomerase class I